MTCDICSIFKIHYDSENEHIDFSFLPEQNWKTKAEETAEIETTS